MRRNVFSFLFFLSVWILPLLYLGVTGRNAPWIPKQIQNLHNTFRLFTGHIQWWPMTYLQAKFGGEVWITLPEGDYFRMKPFGNRTRLTRYQEIFRKPDSPAHRELALWARERHRQLHPRAHEMTAFRIVVGQWYVRNRKFEGVWAKPPLEDFAAENRSVLATQTLS